MSGGIVAPKRACQQKANGWEPKFFSRGQKCKRRESLRGVWGLPSGCLRG